MTSDDTRDVNGGADPVAGGTPPTKPSSTSAWRQGAWLSLVSVGLYFFLWFLVTRDGLALIRPIFFPSPLMLIDAAGRLGSTLVVDIAWTLGRVIVGWTIGVCLGVGLGLVMSYSRKAFYFFNPLIESMRPVPVIAMIPFMLLWFGINEQGKLVLIVLGVFAIMVVSTVEAVRNVQPIYLRAAASLGARRSQVFRRIVMPAIVPELIGPLRVSVALSLTLVAAAEFMGAQNGLGFRILEARRLFLTDVILLGVFVFGLLGAFLDALVRRGTGYLVRWSTRSA